MQAAMKVSMNSVTSAKVASAPTIKELEDFTLKSYTKLVQYLSQIYKIVPFCKIPQEDVKYLILRHDVDFLLSSALRMAQIERDLGIRSTYFILLDGGFYDPLEETNADILTQISKIGHEIGLHYSPAQYRTYGPDMNRTLHTEVKALEQILGTKVRSIARHGLWDRDPFAANGEYINANHPFLRSDIYVHDSCRAWTPLQGLFKLLYDPTRRAQLLVHPENWQDRKIDKETLLRKFCEASEKENPAPKSGVGKMPLANPNTIRKIWLTDPLVLEHDRLLRTEDPARFNGIRSSSVSLSTSKLGYYGALSEWYFINSSMGWRLYRAVGSIRKSLGNLSPSRRK